MRVGFFGDSLTRGIPGSSYLDRMQKLLPGDELVNLGKSNDTVISLFRRVRSMRFARPFDLAFLWVGVNDAACCDSFLMRTASRFRGQRRARDVEEFYRYYSKTLQIVGAAACKSVAVAPLLKGEDLSNQTNRQIVDLARQIEKAASAHPRACYLDLRPTISRYLADKPISNYLHRSKFGVLWDVLRLRTREQIDARSAQRGLWVTLDGVHLNSTGAKIVGRAFVECIVEQRQREGNRKQSQDGQVERGSGDRHRYG